MDECLWEHHPLWPPEKHFEEEQSNEEASEKEKDIDTEHIGVDVHQVGLAKLKQHGHVVLAEVVAQEEFMACIMLLLTEDHTEEADGSDAV